MTMFAPRYTLTDPLLTNIRKIGEMVGELNSKSISKTIFLTLERKARVLSSFSSNKIEGNPLSLTDVKDILKNSPQNLRNTQKEIFNYNKALIYLNGKISNGEKRKISNKLVCNVHSIVTKSTISKSLSGVYRKDAVFVNNPLNGETIYWPPDVADVKVLMRDLVNFVNKSSGNIDPIILAGIFHKQFVVIHPFMDCNGRSARLLSSFILSELKMNSFSLFSFEKYYNKNVSKYFQKVGVVGNYYDIVENMDFTDWLEYFVEGILDELSRVKKELPQYNERLQPHQKKIVQYLRDYGSISSSEYYKISKRARSTRIKDFRILMDRNIIKAIGKGKSTYYILSDEYSCFT